MKSLKSFYSSWSERRKRVNLSALLQPFLNHITQFLQAWGHQIDISHLPKWLDPTVSNFKKWCYISIWLLLYFFKPTTIPSNITHWDSRFFWVYVACYNHLNQWKFVTSSIDVTFLLSVLRLISVSFTW